MLQRAKQFVLARATSLPSGIAMPLLRANKRPDLLFGRKYRAYREYLAQHRTTFDNRELAAAVIADAAEHVPYYREHGVTATIDRDIVAAQPERFIRDGLDRSAYEMCSTGGTSGKPLSFLAPKDRYVVELATMHSLWATAGYDGQPRAVIRNHRLADGRPFIVNPLMREVVFDGFRLDDDHLARVYATIRELGLRFVHCYPSTAYELASVIKRRRLDPTGLVFLSGSETIHPHQRALIQGELGMRFYNWYGHSEKLVLAGYCAGNDEYHVEPTYGVFELVDENGAPVTAVGSVGEIVGTTLHNPGMPLIRYRTGDFAELAGTYCTSCDRHVTLLRNIKGRWNGERIFRSDGTFVTTTALNLHHALNEVIGGMQYVQDKPGAVTVLVTPTERFHPEHQHQLLAHFQSKLGAQMAIDVRAVDRLQRLPNGKFSLVISRVAERPS